MSDQVQTVPAPLIPEVPPQQIGERVWVFTDQRINLVPNIGVVVGDDATLVVDTGMGRRNGERLLERVRELSDKPLLLTLTHFHPEHGWGAQAFAGAATIVYNRVQREELEEKFGPFVELFSSFGPEIAELLSDVRLVRPQIVYDGQEAELDLGGVTVQLSYHGPAHTRGDQLVLLPSERVLFTGDLVENRFFPILPDEDAHGSDWIALLERMEALEATTVVPGHGEVGEIALIGEVREYLEHVRMRVNEAVANGTTLDDVKSQLEPEIRRRYPTWDNEIWIGFAIENFYRERSA
jgi:glyoxylase-like metal-dependent hydrolase (beta-lactamase superfamily II)